MLTVNFIVLLEVSEVVIGFAMADFVRADGENHVSEGCVGSQVIVLYRRLWCLHCSELWQLAPINLLNKLRVGMDSLLF